MRGGPRVGFGRTRSTHDERTHPSYPNVCVYNIRACIVYIINSAAVTRTRGIYIYIYIHRLCPYTHILRIYILLYTRYRSGRKHVRFYFISTRFLIHYYYFSIFSPLYDLDANTVIWMYICTTGNHIALKVVVCGSASRRRALACVFSPHQVH